MSELKEWVRGLVILVLLGSCLELLIPANSMKKYVRMTMGLVIVLAVISPVAAFLGRPVVVESMSLATPVDGSLPTLSQIMIQASEFRERNQGLAMAEARARLAEEARLAALSVPSVESAKSEVTLAGAKTFEIVNVAVTVKQGRGGAAVSPVEPVRVEPEALPSVGPSESALIEAVRRAVAARLGINADPDLVRVTLMGRPKSQRR